jgi:hypothetical protein
MDSGKPAGFANTVRTQLSASRYLQISSTSVSGDVSYSAD